MIIRALRLRHGRIALPRTLTPISQQRHQSSLESEAPTEAADAPVFSQATSTAQAQLDAIPNIRSVHINDPTHPVAKDYAFFMHQKARTQHLGSALEPHYKPHELLANPPSPKDITLELLLASQAHIGHATSLWHPANARYIFGIRGNKAHGEGPIHIISLEATAAHLRRACKIVSGVTERGGLVLFVGTRQGHARAVVKAASMAKGCHLFTKWIPGSITNGQQILGRCAKKVVNEYDEEVEGFEDQLGAKAALKPDLVVCLNPLENYNLLHECGLNNIPTIGIVDTDVNPTWVTYPIPANDDSLRTIQVVAGVLGRAGEEGQEKRLRLARSRDNIITYSATHGLEPPAAPEKRAKKQPAQKGQASPKPAVTSTPTPTDETNFREDVDGVESKQQYQEDQQLLDSAQQILAEQGTAPFTVETAEAESAEQNQYAAEEPAGAEDDVYSASAESIDQSLLDENYGANEQVDEDLAQYGGEDRLNSASTISDPSPSSTAPATPILTPTSEPDIHATQAPTSPPAQAYAVAQELGEAQTSSPSSSTAASSTSSSSSSTPTSQPDVQATQAPESPIDQVEDVARELGEEAPTTTTTPEPAPEVPETAAGPPEPAVSTKGDMTPGEGKAEEGEAEDQDKARSR